MLHCDLQLDTMLDLLRAQVAEHGGSPAYVFLDESGEETTISYNDLEQSAQAVAAELQTRVEPGERVMLVYPAGLEFISAFFGCLYAGVVAVPATYPKPKRPLPRMNRIAIDCGAHIALTTAQTLETIDFEQIDPEVGHLDWIATDDVPSSRAGDWVEPEIDADNLAFLQYTSGSTSDPKGVMVSHRNLLSNLAAIRHSFGIGDVDEDHITSTGVFWLPAYHDMGLIGGILTPLFVGGRSVLMSPTSFLQKPIRWLEAIDKYQATISGAPNFAYELCVKRIAPEARAGLDLSVWRLAFCGAEPIRAEMVQEFTAAYKPHGFRPEALYPCYGLAEATLLAAGPKFDAKPTITRFNRQALAAHQVVPANGEPFEQVQQLVGCGTKVQQHDLVVVDPETNKPLPDGSVGEILLQGPSIARGYWNRPQETSETFAAIVPDREGKFLRTGDLGFISGEQLYVTGRLKDVIIIRGRNHYPQDIEQTVESTHPGLMQGAAFAVPVEGTERLVIVHQVDRQYRRENWEKVSAAIRRNVVASHELDPYAIVLIRQTSLPITSSGKVQRSLCRDQYLHGELKVVHHWTAPTAPNEKSSDNGVLAIQLDGNGVTSSSGVVKAVAEQPEVPRKPAPVRRRNLNEMQLDRAVETIEEWLLNWVVERVGIDPADIDRTKPFAEFGVDSLSAVELSGELEDEFGVPVTSVVAWNHPTPAALSRYLAEQAISAGKVETSETILDQADDSLGDLLAEIENLSEDEAARLLAEEG